jgi:hypothetical protein
LSPNARKPDRFAKFARLSVQSITITYTKRRCNPISWLIRWALPRSRFSLALASHYMIVDGDHCIEATMLHGVCRVPMDMTLADQVTVIAIDYSIPDADAGLDWLRSQVGQPYDWRWTLAGNGRKKLTGFVSSWPRVP